MDPQRHDEDVVRFALVLKPEARSGEGRARTARIAARLGLIETGRGAATIAFRVDRFRFQRIFHASADTTTVVDELGAISRPGAETDRRPAVPDELRDYVDAVSVEPPAILLGPSDAVE